LFINLRAWLKNAPYHRGNQKNARAQKYLGTTHHRIDIGWYRVSMITRLTR